MTSDLNPEHLADLIRRALDEDLGGRGDITSEATVSPSAQAKAEIVARAPGVVAGLPAAEAVFRAVDSALRWTALKQDGTAVEAGEVLAAVEGPARSILTAERTALNFLGHLSGVATETSHYVWAIQGTKAQILDTRKTTPTLRALEKYAVRMGGGANHRFGLFDAVLIKDNHVAAAGGVGAAVRAALARAPQGMKVEVEVQDLDQLREALAAGANWVLLDNMSLDQMREAVRLTDGRAKLEASGGVGLESVRAIAETGVDFISVGRITHSAPCLDLALDFVGS